jgi:hypothetical protein
MDEWRHFFRPTFKINSLVHDAKVDADKIQNFQVRFFGA